jgi:hypothetical protein
MSGATTSVSSLNENKMTDQDYYNIVHNAILSGGNQVSVFGIDFSFTDSIPSAAVSNIDNVLSGGQYVFVGHEDVPVPIGGIGLPDGFTTTISMVTLTATISFYSIGPFLSNDGMLENLKAGGDNCMFISLPDQTPDNVGATTALTVRASSVAKGPQNLCGVIGVLESAAGAVQTVPGAGAAVGIVTAIGSLVCNLLA